MNIVGVLQYLSLTRPDVAFLVNKNFQYLYAPITEHMVAAKRILRYIQRPVGLGIKFVRDSTVSIVSLSDADWLVALMIKGQQEVCRLSWREYNFMEC